MSAGNKSMTGRRYIVMVVESGQATSTAISIYRTARIRIGKDARAV
jgi:hypothetical protein